MLHKLIDSPRLLLKADGDTEETAGPGTIEGYGSAFGVVDSQEERVVKGAFTDTIEEFVNDGFIAVGHDWMSLPVATPMSAAEDKVGLKFGGEFHTTEEAQKARTVVRERLSRSKSVKLSIGYDILEEKVGTDKVRELTKLRLYEISIVTVPANWDANVTGAKGMNGGLLGRAGAANLTNEDHAKLLLAEIEVWVKRLDGLAAIRAKESRTLSAASLGDIDAALEYIKQSMKTLQSLKDRATVSKGMRGEIDRQYMRLALHRQATRELVGG